MKKYGLLATFVCAPVLFACSDNTSSSSPNTENEQAVASTSKSNADAAKHTDAGIASGVDYHSFANPNEIRVTHLSLDLTANFESKQLVGEVTLDVERTKPENNTLVLDTRALEIQRVSVEGESVPFVMELPAYHVPTLRGILTHTWERLKGFLIRAGRVILVVVMVLSFLNSIGTDGSFGNQDSEDSILSHIGMSITPVFSPMGIREENWPATVGLITGIFAKEAVVGTLDSLYSVMDVNDLTEEEPFAFWDAVQEAFSTIPEGLLGVIGSIGDPLGINVGVIEDISTAAAEQEVTHSTFGAMKTRFDGTVGAFAYLLFILLYAPCVAALAAIWREISPGWAVFSSVYLSLLAWSVSVFYYQAATFAEHPQTSLFWLVFVSTLLSGGSAGFVFWKGKISSSNAPLLKKGYVS